MLGKIRSEVSKKGPTALIILGVLTILSLYNNFYKQFTRFHFPSRSVNRKTVIETGKVKFSSGNELSFKNRYKSSETVTKSGSKLTVTGKYEGNIDPKLRPYLKKDSYHIEIDTARSGFDIDPKFSVVYPVAFKRFLYFMPVGNLFDNKKWEIVTKNQEFSCSYQLFLKAEKDYVSLICSGIVGGSNAAMLGEVVLNKGLNGFRSTELEITVEDQFKVSTWNFSEEFLK